MKITSLRKEKCGDRARVSAIVCWEDCSRPAYELYFETTDEFAPALSPNPHAFLIACAIPAMHYGEKRVFIDEEICPELQEGLRVAMGWLRHWFGPKRDLIRIEARPRSHMPIPLPSERAGLFLSGGIDSLATLRTNRLHFPPEHPRSIKDCLVVYGLEVDEPQSFEYVMDSLADIAQDTAITLIPIYTNLYLHYKSEDAKDEFSFWKHKFNGAALAAVAHAFSTRLSGVSISASDSLHFSFLGREGLIPWGTHPLLDPNYSSSDLRIKHCGIALSRLAKTKLVAEWDVALQHLHVCNQSQRYKPKQLNCGRCEKCVHTMLTLVAYRALHQTRAFPVQDVTEKQVRPINFRPSEKYEYLDLIAPLAKIGRHDLVRAIKRKLVRSHLSQNSSRLGEMIKRCDEKYLKGELLRFKRQVLS